IMEISEGISLFFEQVPFKNWSPSKCLEYLETVSKSAQKKANKLYNEVDQLFESEEVITIFKRMDTKVIEESKRQLLAVKKSLRYGSSAYCQRLQNIYCIIFRTETPGEVSKRKREIEDDQIVTDPNEKSLQDLFGAEFQCSENMMLVCQYHNELYVNDSLIDLRSNSNFTNKLPSSLLKPYLKELDDKIENLIPSNVHNFLTEFFKQNLTDNDWNIKIDDLIMAFSLGPRNPLLNLATLEKPHLNNFVYPCLQACLWYISLICYEFGEISTRNHKRECTDGVGYLNTADKFQLVYVEGSKPDAKDDKEIADASKISNNLQKIFLNIVKENVKCRRRLPKSLAIFGGQRGKFCLNEVDNANIPRDFTEMADFVFFYECMIKWALLAWKVKKDFEESRAQKRLSRLSFINGLNVANAL
ncbi:10654_t:CDS:2, partial [Ambispora gerdemannii]